MDKVMLGSRIRDKSWREAQSSTEFQQSTILHVWVSFRSKCDRQIHHNRARGNGNKLSEQSIRSAQFLKVRPNWEREHITTHSEGLHKSLHKSWLVLWDEQRIYTARKAFVRPFPRRPWTRTHRTTTTKACVCMAIGEQLKCGMYLLWLRAKLGKGKAADHAESSVKLPPKHRRLNGLVSSIMWSLLRNCYDNQKNLYKNETYLSLKEASQHGYSETFHSFQAERPSKPCIPVRSLDALSQPYVFSAAIFCEPKRRMTADASRHLRPCDGISDTETELLCHLDFSDARVEVSRHPGWRDQRSDSAHEILPNVVSSQDGAFETGKMESFCNLCWLVPLLRSNSSSSPPTIHKSPMSSSSRSNCIFSFSSEFLMWSAYPPSSQQYAWIAYRESQRYDRSSDTIFRQDAIFVHLSCIPDRQMHCNGVFVSSWEA